MAQTGIQGESRPASRAAGTGVSAWGACMAAAALAIYGPTLLWLADRWMHDHFYSHGVLVAGASLWFAWEKRETLRALPVAGSRWGVPVVLFGLAAQMAAAAGDILTLSALSMPVVAAGLVLAWRGGGGLRVLGFPIFFSLFAIPIASSGSEASGRILTPMMAAAASSTASLANLLGLKAELSGTIIRLPGYTMQIVAPCSGMASLVSLMPFGALLGYFAGAGPARIALLIASAFPIAFVCNVARLLFTALLGVTCGPKIASGFLHDASGFVTFLLGAVVMAALPRGSR